MWLLSRCATTASSCSRTAPDSTLLAGGLLVDHRLLGNEDGHRRALRIVVLAGDVEDVGADDLGHVGEDLGQAIGVVGLVDVLDVALALLFGDARSRRRRC
jgi:hypothetical protein